MKKTGLKVLLAAAVIVMIAAVVGLVVKLVSGNKSDNKDEKESEKESVTVWLRTTEYTQSNGSDPLRTAWYEYDEYGRCVEEQRVDTVRGTKDIHTITYDEETRQTTDVLERSDPSYRLRIGSMYNAAGEMIREWYDYEDSPGVFIRTSEDIYKPYPDGKYGLAVILGCRGDRVVSAQWREYDEASRVACWMAAMDYDAGICPSELAWEDVKAAAIPSSTLEGTEEYDERGHLKEEKSATSTGQLVVKHSLEYREDGTLFWEAEYGEGTFIRRDYDEQERVVSIIETENGEEVRTVHVEYEDLPSGLHRKTTHTVDLTSATPEDRNSFIEVDDNARTEKEWITGPDGLLLLVHVITKDEQGHLIREEFPPMEQVEEREYDQNGNLVKYTYTVPNVTKVVTFEYTELVLKKDKAAYAAEFYAPVIGGE